MTIRYADTKTMNEYNQMKEILCRIGYPRRGTREETATLQEFADEIQARWPNLREEVTEERGDPENEANMVVRSRLRSMAKFIESLLPRGYGFFVLCFPFGEGGRAEYASNAKREDVMQAMKEFIERNIMQMPGDN